MAVEPRPQLDAGDVSRRRRRRRVQRQPLLLLHPAVTAALLLVHPDHLPVPRHGERALADSFREGLPADV